MTDLTAIILAKNEELNIKECIESIKPLAICPCSTRLQRSRKPSPSHKRPLINDPEDFFIGGILSEFDTDITEGYCNGGGYRVARIARRNGVFGKSSHEYGIMNGYR